MNKETFYLTMDNSEKYSQDQLNEINARFLTWWVAENIDAEIEKDPTYDWESTIEAKFESIIRDYDTEQAIITEVLKDVTEYEGLNYDTARIVEAEEFDRLITYWADCRQMTTSSGIEYAEIGEDSDTAELIILRK